MAIWRGNVAGKRARDVYFKQGSFVGLFQRSAIKPHCGIVDGDVRFERGHVGGQRGVARLVQVGGDGQKDRGLRLKQFAIAPFKLARYLQY